MEKKYPNFKKYKSSFESKKALQELIEFAKKEGVEFNEGEYKESKKTIEIRLQANMAQDLFDYKKFYEIINELNTSLQKAKEIINNEQAFSKLIN